MTKLEILECYPTLERKDGKWKKRSKIVGRHKGGFAVSEGREVVQVVVEGRARWFDPATGHELQKTKRGDGLWDKEDQCWYRPFFKREWEEDE